MEAQARLLPPGAKKRHSRKDLMKATGRDSGKVRNQSVTNQQPPVRVLLEMFVFSKLLLALPLTGPRGCFTLGGLHLQGPAPESRGAVRRAVGWHAHFESTYCCPSCCAAHALSHSQPCCLSCQVPVACPGCVLLLCPAVIAPVAPHVPQHPAGLRVASALGPGCGMGKPPRPHRVR
jgi:hypothetical protein